MGDAIVVVAAFVLTFLVDLARQWWRDRRRARRAGGVEVHTVRAWPGRDRALARPGTPTPAGERDLVVRPGDPRGVPRTNVTVIDVDEHRRGLIDRFRDEPRMVIQVVASGSALSIESRWTSDLVLALAQRQPRTVPRSESTVLAGPDHEYAVQGLPWWGWVVPAAGAVLIGGFLLLNSLGLHTTGTVVASTEDAVSTVTWTDPTTGAQRRDTVDSSGSETEENEASTHAGLSVGGVALGVTVLASWGVVAARRRDAVRARSLPALVGTVPAQAFGAEAAELGGRGADRDEGDTELDADSTMGSDSRQSHSTWTPITARLAQRAAAEDWNGEPGAWPTRGRVLRRALQAAIVPLVFTLGAAAFLVDAAQAAILLNTRPTTTQQTLVDDIDAGIPLLDACWLGSANPAGIDLSAPCSGLHEGDEVTAQVLSSPRTTLFGTSPARILEPAGHDTTQRSIVLLALASAISLGVLLSGLVSRLRPVRAQARAVKQAREQGCELRYARVRHIDEEVLLLFPHVGEAGPRWAIDLAGPLPTEVPLGGHLRLAGPLQPGGWAPQADTWSVPIIAERPIWGVSRLYQLEPDDVTELLRGPGEVLADIAHEDGTR